MTDTGVRAEEIRDGLLAAYPEMAVEELAEVLYQARVLAALEGRR